MAATTAQVAATPRRLTLARIAPAVALVAVVAFGAALRFANFASVGTTPFYDAAVRSMGLSWHNFFYGALDPLGQTSIDKAPVDLWLQVATTKLFGFSSVSLRIPPALAGTLIVPLLYDIVRRGFGRAAGLAAALTFAVLPATVLTSRSDTMDTVMALVLVVATWLIVRARPERRARAVIAAGAVAGLAFEVKLFEGAVALPAIALLAWLALDAPAARKARTLALAGVAFLATASAWGIVASLWPGHHPFPYGSSDGSIFNVLVVYNGFHRVGNPPTGATAPGLLRLFDPARPREFGVLIGVLLLPALVFGAVAAVSRGRTALAAAVTDDQDRLRRAIGCGFAAWLILGTIVASLMGRQWTRYLEAFTPAVAVVLGIAIVTVGRAALQRRWAAAALLPCAAAAALAGPLTGGGHTATAIAVALAVAAVLLATSRRAVAAATALVLAAALVVPAATSVHLIRTGAGDAEPTGTLTPPVLDSVSSYLRAHQGSARYELAASNVFKGAAFVTKDALPTLTLTSFAGRPLVTPAELARDGAHGVVRYAMVGVHPCPPGSSKGPDCSPVVRWVRAHGTDVSKQAGMPHRGRLYRLPG